MFLFLAADDLLVAFVHPYNFRVKHVSRPLTETKHIFIKEWITGPEESPIANLPAVDEKISAPKVK